MLKTIDLRLFFRSLFCFIWLILWQSCDVVSSNKTEWSFDRTDKLDTLQFNVQPNSSLHVTYDSSYEQALADFRQRFNHLFDQVVYYTKIDSTFYFAIYKGSSKASVIDLELGVFDLEENALMGLVDQHGLEIIPMAHHKIYNFNQPLCGYFMTRSANGYQFYNHEGDSLLPMPFPVIIPQKNAFIELRREAQICRIYSNDISILSLIHI